jgi:sterol O-acyltransferase
MKGYKYQHRISILDDMDDNSILSKSKLHGFYYYMHMLGFYYLIDLLYFG